MGEGANPVIPTGWEILVSGIGAALLVLLVWTVIRLARSRAVTGLERLGLLFLCFMLPGVGPVCALAVLARRENARRS